MDVPLSYRLVVDGCADRPLIRTRDDLLELIAHVLRLQLSYLSNDQALAVADTILRTRPRGYRSGCYVNRRTRMTQIADLETRPC